MERELFVIFMRKTKKYGRVKVEEEHTSKKTVVKMKG